ncbi:hypothetical protein LJR235_001287 [Pararhizobium sp. LjRoot235]|uniref:hypothetical protein n=1 Tax=Pararhizobium sp. LjRoot235 TaxID=3342291 RepID=UPI003ECD089E
MKNSWFGTTAVPAIEAFLPAYRLTPENSAGADIGTIPSGALRPFLDMAVTITLGATCQPALYLSIICRFRRVGNRRPSTNTPRCNIATF